MPLFDDNFQTKFTMESPPRSVVSLVPSITESLFDLNVGDRLIARTDYCIHPAEQVATIPTIGGTKNPDVERIIAMQPDLVIANQEENRRHDVEKIQNAGIPVWVTFPKIVPHAFNILWDIMELFDETSMVPRIRLIEYTFDWLNNMAEANDNPPRVFVPIWLDPLMTINEDTYTHDLLRVVGAHNCFAKRQRLYPLQADLGYREPTDQSEDRDTRYPRITLQEVEDAQPDVIVLPSEPFHFTHEHIPIFQALDVPASRHNRIHLVDGSLLTWHGTRIAYAMEQLPTLFRLEG